MSLDDLIEADAEMVISPIDFGRTFVRYPEGVLETPADVVGLWEPDEPPTLVGGQSREVVFAGTLFVAASQAVTRADRWLIDGDKWECSRIGKPQHGLIPVYLKTENKIRKIAGANQ